MVYRSENTLCITCFIPCSVLPPQFSILSFIISLAYNTKLDREESLVVWSDLVSTRCRRDITASKVRSRSHASTLAEGSDGSSYPGIVHADTAGLVGLAS